MSSTKPPSSPDRLAAWLHRMHEEGARFEPFASAAGLVTAAEAYRVQSELVALRQRSEGPRAGWKLALTSPQMQAMVGIHEPVTGVLTAGRLHAGGYRAALGGFGRLGLECEICLGIGRDLPPLPEPRAPGGIAAAVAWVAPAFEMVDDRGASYGEIDALSLVADNAMHAGVVLGRPMPCPDDLDARTGRLSVDGVSVGEGAARDVMGGPLQALAWLAAHLGARGETIPAGSIVMTGSLIVTRFPEAQGVWRFEVEGLGAVEMQVAA